MDAGSRYNVVVVHRDGKREMRASNVTLETAQAAQFTLAPLFPKAQVMIEPHRPTSRD